MKKGFGIFKRGRGKNFTIILALVLLLVPLLLSCEAIDTVKQPTIIERVEALENRAISVSPDQSGEINSLKSEIKSLENGLASLKSSVASIPDNSALSSQISTMSAEMTTLRTRVIELETKKEEEEEEEEDIDPEDAVEISMRYSRDLKPGYGVAALEPGNTYRLSGRVRTKLDNQLSVAIEDIILLAQVRITSETSGIEIVNVELVGEEFEWDEAGGDEFESWGDIELDATGDLTEFSTLFVTVENTSENPISSYKISIERIRIECDDYEIAE